jgi:hypothetical protein
MANSEATYKMAVPNISGTGADPTHHVVLYDGTTEIGFVVTDQGGDMDERTFRRFPFADPVQPYVTEKQNSFGAGFGQHKFEENRSRYWLSDGVDTTKDRIVLAPQFHYGSGAFEESVQNLEVDGAYNHAEILSADRYYATEFTPHTTLNGVTAVKIFIGRTGTPPQVLTVSIYSNSSDKPNSSLTSETIAPSQVEEEDGQWIKVDFTYSGNLNSGTKYHLVVDSAGGTSSNHWHVLRGNTDTNGSTKSTNGSSWLAGDGDIYFRIEGESPDCEYQFFEYKSQMYAVQKFPSTSTDKLWMNGWRGACDGNTGQLDNLEDSTNGDWATRIDGGEIVEIPSGPYSGLQDDWRDVNADSLGELANGTLPVTPNWVKAHTTDDNYIVKGSNWFTRITDSIYTLGKVKDVEVANGIVFFCRGGGTQVMLHREHNLDGVWSATAQDDWATGDQMADFAQVVRDPRGGNFIWFGQNANNNQDRRPDVCRARVTTWGDWSTNYISITPLARWTSADSHVTASYSAGTGVQLKVTVNEILTAGISVAGTGYTNGSHAATIIDSGSSGTGEVQITVSGGQVTAITAYNNRGYDYTTGEKQFTSAGAGAGDGLARIEITALDGFTTGLIAYRDLEDDDENAYTVDLRYANKFAVDLLYRHWQDHDDGEYDGTVSLSAAQLNFVADDQTTASSPFLTIPFPQLRSSQMYGDYWERLDAPSGLDVLAGAESCASVGLTLAQATSKSFTIHLWMPIRAFTEDQVVTVGHRDGDDITGMEVYGDPEELWVFSESGMGAVANNRYKPVPLRELLVAHHPNNGKANEVHDVYLLFSWRGRLQRFFRQNLEDLGPEFPAGMSDIQGDIVDVVTYPGRVYAAVDSRDGKSLILVHKGGAWHEVYTSFPGERIRNLYIQSMQGKSDRLWASVGTGVMWFPIALNSVELEANSDYKYRPEGHLITSWVYTSEMELNKLFRSVVVVMDRAEDADLNVELKYQIDDEDSAWVLMDNVDDKNASAKEYNFSDGTAGASIQGNRVRLRISIHSHDATKTPVVRSIQFRIYKLPEVRYAWSWISKASNISINLRGDEERSLGTQTSVLLAIQKIDSWASNMTQLTVDSSIEAFDNRVVLIEPIPYQLLTLVNDEGLEEDVIQVTVNDI